MSEFAEDIQAMVKEFCDNPIVWFIIGYMFFMLGYSLGELLLQGEYLTFFLLLGTTAFMQHPFMRRLFHCNLFGQAGSSRGGGGYDDFVPPFVKERREWLERHPGASVDDYYNSGDRSNHG